METMKDKLEIISLPHPALRQPSQKVGIINKEIHALIQTMLNQATTWEKNRDNEVTVGLAAIQINRPLKVIIIRENFDSDKEAIFKVLINPKITKYNGKKTIQLEGCLSVPDFYTNIERYEEVKVTALDENGDPIKLKAKGFLARIIQHELDHLKGIMTVDRATPTSNEAGEEFSFCRLTELGKFEIVTDEEVRRTEILKDD